MTRRSGVNRLTFEETSTRPQVRASAVLDAQQLSSAIPVLTDVIELPVAPGCPKCGVTMAMRRATRGKLAGHFFWSCADAPRCSGILPCTY